MSTPSKSFIITTRIRGKNRSQVWDGSAPLPLGHPFRWVIEQTDAGVRVRDLNLELNEIKSDAVHDVSQALLEKGATVELPGVELKIQSSRELAPAYERAPSANGKLNAFTCAGNCILSSSLITKNYTGILRGQSVFTLTQQKDSCVIAATQKGAIAISSGKTRNLEPGAKLELTREELSRTEIFLHPLTWRFGYIEAPALPTASRSHGAALDREDARFFFRSMIGAVAAFLFLLALTWVWPKPEKEEELIPPQYAQILLAQPKAKPAQAQAAPQGGPALPTPKKAQDTAVAQAFRAQALQSAVSGLLKGGMTRLLQQSDFVVGARQAANAKRIFDGKSAAMVPTAANVGLADNRNSKVSSLGGEGGSGGKGVGYGKGAKAGVQGQGGSFVAMETAGSSVEEGLTKDEVGEVIHRHLSEVRYCYESAMIRTPDIEGKLMVAFTIGGSGMVKTAAVKSSTLPDPRLDDCIIRRLVTWKFPNPKGGIDVAVTYPFIFKTLGR